MAESLNVILDKLEKWNPIIALIVTVFVGIYYLFYFLERSTDIIHKIKFKKIALLKEHFPSVQSEDLKNAYYDIIEAYYFKVATGIYMEDKQVRSSLIQLREKISYPITWKIVKHVYPFFVIENGKIKTIEIPWIDKVAYCSANVIYWIFSLLFIVLLMFSSTKIAPLTIHLFLIPLLPASLMLPIIRSGRSARKMKKELSCPKSF